MNSAPPATVFDGPVTQPPAILALAQRDDPRDVARS